MLLACGTLSAQRLIQLDPLSPEEVDMVGVWKIDLLKQQNNLGLNKIAQLDTLDGAGKERFWEAISSWVYALDEQGKFAMTWVQDDSFNIVEGKWDYDPNTNILSLKSEDELIEYTVQHIGKDQLWIPKVKVREGFDLLYINGIHLILGTHIKKEIVL